MKSIINFAHGGHSGDIIYGIPLAKYLSKLHNSNATYHILSDRAATFQPGVEHPNGIHFNMNETSYNFIRPLLESQKFIDKVCFTKTKDLPNETYFLDYFRDINGINQSSGSIANWSKKFFGLNINTDLPWLDVNIKKKDIITCTFSRRYRNKRIQYSFLDNYDSYFIGLQDEYDHFVKINGLKNLKFQPVNDAVEMAKFIASSLLFIGNQSFGFSLAEAMKVNRALEVCELCPNVIPTGNGAFEYLNSYALKNILNNFGIDYHNQDTRLDCEFTYYYD